MTFYFDKKEKQLSREDKPTWRERDAKKSNNPYSSNTHEGKTSHVEALKQSQSKQALDELFKPKKSESQNNDFEALLKSKGSEFQKLGAAYIASYGTPKTIDDLIVFLDIQDPLLLEPILEAIESLLPEIAAGKKDLVLGKLKVTALSISDSNMADYMYELIEGLEA